MENSRSRGAVEPLARANVSIRCAGGGIKAILAMTAQSLDPGHSELHELACMAKHKLKVGDIVEVTHYTPVHYTPGVKDELGTEALFRSMVGKRFRVMGFDKFGHIELHPTRRDWIWIKVGDVKLVPRKKEKS